MFPISLSRVVLRSSWCFSVPNELKIEAIRRSFHAIHPQKLHQQNLNVVQESSNLLVSVNEFLYAQTRGLKYVGNVHRRCKDCHLMLKEGIMHNYCKAHPRHNQKAITSKPKCKWILTAVTTNKIRSW